MSLNNFFNHPILLQESARKEGDNSLVSKIDDFKDENGQLNKKIEGLVQENAQKEKELTEERGKWE